MEELYELVDMFYSKNKITNKDVKCNIKAVEDALITPEYTYTTLVENYVESSTRRGKKTHMMNTIQYFNNKVRSPCVYKLYNEDSLVYIGKTVNLSDRICSHSETKEFDKTEAYFCNPLEDVDALENGLILKYTPALNKTVSLDKARLWEGQEPLFVPTSKIKVPLINYHKEMSMDFKKENYIRAGFLKENLVLNKKGIIPYWKEG